MCYLSYFLFSCCCLPLYNFFKMKCITKVGIQIPIIIDRDIQTNPTMLMFNLSYSRPNFIQLQTRLKHQAFDLHLIFKCLSFHFWVHYGYCEEIKLPPKLLLGCDTFLWQNTSLKHQMLCILLSVILTFELWELWSEMHCIYISGQLCKFST